MSRQLEQRTEERQSRRERQIVRAIEFELEKAVGATGRLLTGFSAKGISGDCLLVLRAEADGHAEVAFVGGEDLGAALAKAVREGFRNGLRWRPDRYAGP